MRLHVLFDWNRSAWWNDLDGQQATPGTAEHRSNVAGTGARSNLRLF